MFRVFALLVLLLGSREALAQANPWQSSVSSQSGTTYPVATTDCGTTVNFSSGTAVTVTLPSTMWLGCPVKLVQTGAGVVTISGSTIPLGTFSTVGPGSFLATGVIANPGGAAASWLVGAGGVLAQTQSPGDATGLLASDAFVGAAVSAGAYTLPAATLTTLGGVKGNLSYFAKTASSINVTLGAISVLGISILPSVTVTVPGVTAGDFVLASFAGTVPTSITIGGVQATAANTVVITPIATAALVAGSQVVVMNFAFMH